MLHANVECSAFLAWNVPAKRSSKLTWNALVDISALCNRGEINVPFGIPCVATVNSEISRPLVFGKVLTLGVS